MKQILVVAIALIATASISSCGSSSASTPKEKIDSTSVTQESSKVGETWEYSNTTDEMGEKTEIARLYSSNEINLDFPYNGGSQSKLVLMKRPNGTLEILYNIDKGQINTDYDGTYFRVKFDDQPVQKWSMSEASDNSSNNMFFNNEKSFIDKLKKSKKLVVEIPFYQNGNQQVVFNTENLKF